MFEATAARMGWLALARKKVGFLLGPPFDKVRQVRQFEHLPVVFAFLQSENQRESSVVKLGEDDGIGSAGRK